MRFDVDKNPFTEFPELKLTQIPAMIKEWKLPTSYVWAVLFSYHPESPMKTKARSQRVKNVQETILPKGWDANLYDKLIREYLKFFADNPVIELAEIMLERLTDRNTMLKNTSYTTVEEAKSLDACLIASLDIIEKYETVTKKRDEAVKEVERTWAGRKETPLEKING